MKREYIIISNIINYIFLPFSRGAPRRKYSWGIPAGGWVRTKLHKKKLNSSEFSFLF
ncbi:MAG: hypothetical protein Q8M44_02480 [bacterium]|nr:hypothetical protein [bacterium]